MHSLLNIDLIFFPQQATFHTTCKYVSRLRLPT